MANTRDSKNRRFLGYASSTWATGDTIDQVRKQLASQKNDCIIYMISPPAPAWVDGMGRIHAAGVIGQQERSKVFPVLDLRKRETKKRATSSKELFSQYEDEIDSGTSKIYN